MHIYRKPRFLIEKMFFLSLHIKLFSVKQSDLSLLHLETAQVEERQKLHSLMWVLLWGIPILGDEMEVGSHLLFLGPHTLPISCASIHCPVLDSGHLFPPPLRVS